MKIYFDKVTRKNKNMFLNLWQFFGYDISEMNKMDLDRDGKFILPPDIDDYTDNEDYCSYILKVDGNIAGLAVIRFIDKENINYFRHYFILRKYRRLGIGKEAAFMMFATYPGKWRVSQFDYNQFAISFWREVIKEYTDGNFIETRRLDDRGPQQEFKI